MKLTLSILLAVGAVSAQSVLLEPYAQCGGLGWTGAYECQAGYTCSPIGTNAFPNYQCTPNVGPVVAHAFPYGQCGGQTFVGPTLCAPGWDCVVQNLYFSTCVQNANYTNPTSPTPDLSAPGSYCATTATDRGFPAACVPGYTCSGPGVFGYYVCLLSKSSSTSTTAAPTTVVTTMATSTKKSSTSTKSTSTKPSHTH